MTLTMLKDIFLPSHLPNKIIFLNFLGFLLVSFLLLTNHIAKAIELTNVLYLFILFGVILGLKYGEKKK